jgi:hypothetical protein
VRGDGEGSDEERICWWVDLMIDKYVSLLENQTGFEINSRRQKSDAEKIEQDSVSREYCAEKDSGS